VPAGFYRGEGYIRNYNTMEEYRQVDKAAHIERAGRTIWDAINDGTIFSCPSLLSSFSAICYADLKKFKFTYQFAYPALHGRQGPDVEVQRRHETAWFLSRKKGQGRR
jgi:ubiquitin-like modifier-activating enzyme ATG7